jgi:uracil-DNA glycosylase
MDAHTDRPVAELVSAAFGWWRDAGVDHDFHDEPADWLATPVVEEAPPPPAPPEPVRARAAPVVAKLDLAAMPSDLAAFRDWWLAEPTLDDGRTAGRVPPSGQAGAELMILVPQPEADDGEYLLSGPQGRLIGAMLAAMGLESAYLASVLVRPTPQPDWPTLAASGMGEVISRHVALVRPKRLIVMGGSILPLIGHDPSLSAHPIRSFNHEGGSVPLLATRDPAMFERAATKARFWRDWLAWTDPG